MYDKMKSVLSLLKNSSSWFFKLRNNLETAKTVNMIGKKSSQIDDVIPSKRLALEKVEEAGDLKKQEKVKVRKVALLLSYVGDNYYGMQKNDNFRTIEGELLQALHKSGVIKAEELMKPYLIQFQITARTDKGVSAAKQVVSLKMAENYCVKTINEHLPDDIKLFSVRRVTKGFLCRKECTARTYSYTLPTFALAPQLHTEYPETYRIDEETMQKVNELLLKFVGTHNFHNFTSKKLYNDPSAMRYIMSFKSSEPFVQDIEFVTLTVKGQSFMMHQIRKMIGHLIAIIKGLAPPNMEEEVWTEKKFAVPKAPGLGLVLENIHFDWYNKKYLSDGIHESLAWEDFENEVQSFRNKILSRIVKKEVEEKLMFEWIVNLQEHSFENSNETDAAKEDGSENIQQESATTN